MLHLTRFRRRSYSRSRFFVSECETAAKLDRVMCHGYTPLADIRRGTLYPTSRRSIVALSSRLGRDITAFHCIYAAMWEMRTDGRTETRMHGFILRRRKRENHIDARNTTSKNAGDRLEVYDTSFFSYRTFACTLRSSITFCRLALTLVTGIPVAMEHSGGLDF